MALTDDERRLLGKLQIKVGRAERRNRLMEAYYEGEQRVEQLGLAIPPELRRFLTIAAWPGTWADEIAARTTLEGFELPDATEADEQLWRIWQANGLDAESKLGQLDAIVRGSSFLVIGAGDADTPDAPSPEGGDDDRERSAEIPLISVESADEMAVELSPRTRQPIAGAKFYTDDGTAKATLYQPRATVWLERRNAQWVEVDRDEHDLGVVPVVPLVRGARLSRRDGRSIFTRIIGLTDAAARALTNGQVATEALAVPQRFAAGMKPEDFRDKDGNLLPTWEAYFGAVWATQNPDAKFGSFSAADLANFDTIVSLYAKLVSGVSGLPMRYLGQATTNPPSAEGILADESRVIKQVEDFQTALEAAYERAMKIAVRIRDGRWDPRMEQLETQWRSAATPTRAQAADYAVKLVQQKIIPREAAWVDLGYSAARRKKLAALFAAEEARDPSRLIARELGRGRNGLTDADVDDQADADEAVPAGAG
ncbi:phage portal protein [Micromonospora sp. NPDC050187]|uniref:phage portal protein n=1 Tax=Micromonospora sp. NPDC050187 TaxID=3364277 RepID=UPI0037AA07A3